MKKVPILSAAKVIVMIAMSMAMISIAILMETLSCVCGVYCLMVYVPMAMGVSTIIAYCIACLSSLVTCSSVLVMCWYSSDIIYSI